MHLRRQKRNAQKNGATGQNGRRTVFGSVTCDIHGVEVKGKNGREVKVGAPRTKRERFKGCPACAALRNKAKAA